MHTGDTRRNPTRLSKLAPLLARQLATGLGVIGAIGLAVLVNQLPTDASRTTRVGTVEWRLAAAPTAADAPWQSESWWDIAHVARPIEARFQVWIHDPGSERLALRLSGPFSAKVWLNGRYVGSKGEPASHPSSERPGPIDALIPLGAGLQPGQNIIGLEITARHAGYRPGRLFNDLDIVDRSEAVHRGVIHYLPALTQAGLLALLAAAGLGLCLTSRRTSALLALSVASLAVMTALGLESLRSLVNYSYPWHGVRLAGIALSLAIAGNSLLIASCAHATLPVHAHRFWSGLLATSVLLLVAGWTSALSLDTSALLLLLLPLLPAAWLLAGSDKITRQIAAGLFIGLAFAAVADERSTLDNTLYLILPVAILLLAAGERGLWRIEPTPAPRLSLPSMARPIPLAEISFVQARGNYVELTSRTGAVELVRATLDEVMSASGNRLVRVHRSYLVNLERARSLSSSGGGRYQLHFLDGQSVPVSRSRVQAVRTHLASTPAASTETISTRNA